MGLGYWVLLWIMMALAFGVAWLFIVKGCEKMDAKTEQPASDLENNQT